MSRTDTPTVPTALVASALPPGVTLPPGTRLTTDPDVIAQVTAAALASGRLTVDEDGNYARQS